jgi:SAM-dependent methyltransferase
MAHDDLTSEIHQRFIERYHSGEIPWDTGISPPELLQAITGESALVPGYMLDIGCGTGTNCITLATLGWQTTGLDFVDSAITMAQEKADTLSQEIINAHGSTRFFQADVTQWEPPDAHQYSLLLDIGCLNGIPPHRRPDYVRVASTAAAPHALFLLYAHLPRSDDERRFGCTPDEIDDLFKSTFILDRREMGTDPAGFPSMWNWLRRCS